MKLKDIKATNMEPFRFSSSKTLTLCKQKRCKKKIDKIFCVAYLLSLNL